ncbi:MAG: DinB family protein [Chitinophagaceae bacterium]|nr:DinB family protein [Chitinophagaceae bacterium]
MQLQKPLINLLAQLRRSLEQIGDEQYQHSSDILSGTSVGAHVRHVIEFFVELFKGYDSGTVNYDNRRRDHAIEKDRVLAIESLGIIAHKLLRDDKSLLLEATFPLNETGTIHIHTNYYRELLYNLEHIVHHMALIRIGIEAVTKVELPEEFGIAESTIQFRKACAQ